MKTPEEILNFHLSLSSSIPPSKSFYLAAMEYYGKQQYNQGVKDAAENARTTVDMDDLLFGIETYMVDKESILNLLKP